ncbi:DNA primase small subunit domain-containing protein [Candidatus Nanohalococcus occultus]|uniref:DNA primase small subunit domain-containing protein n=1 Tax=Candidatus Nanohalococcus occultus TaxID=2978047 RepID=UPI0039E1E023
MSDEENSRKPQDWKIRQYYEQDEVKQHILETAEYREIAPTYPNGYGRRPDAINFPGDYLNFVDDGAVSFHSSVERWKNPLLIDDVSDLSNLRTGWDLVIDIDCDPSFELAKDTAELVIEELRQHGIEEISVKFSGNRGFHIGVRSEAFPKKVNDKEVAKMYPALPRGIIQYIRDDLKDRMVEKVRDHGFEEEMKTDDGNDPYSVSDIENNWGQRHLFRMPYSLHDSSWLVSLPINPDEIGGFERSDAQMDKVSFEKGFLDSFKENEAKTLVVQAMDFLEEQQEQIEERRNLNKEFDTPDEVIEEENWPPTIMNILDGLADGRKRALLILINFFRTIGMGWEELESRIWNWNDENKEPLRESYVKSQLNWHRRQDEVVPPPNYDANGYYKDMQVYEGDNLEEQVSNPVTYAFRKSGGGNEQETDMYACPYCGKEYKQKKSFKKHVRQCDGDGEVKRLD